MTKTAEPEETADEIVVNAPPSTPFDDTENPSKSFDVTEPVHVARLQSEIAEVLGHPVQVILQQQDMDAPVSAKNPATVYVSAEKEFDGRKVRGALTAHDSTDANGEALAKDLEALRSGKDLNAAGLSRVLRSIVG